MTNALAENLEKQSTVADLIMQNLDVSSDKISKINKKSAFSNIINNLDARTKSAETKFEQQAKVSNTSSINKEALSNATKETVRHNTKKDIKKDLNNTNQKDYSKEVETKEKNTEKTVEKNQTTKQENAETVDNNKKKIETETKESSSDINNSSPVESSPVFPTEENSLEQNKETEIQDVLDDIEVAIEKIITVAPIVSDSGNIQTQDFKNKVEDVLNNIENLEELKIAVEEISTSLDNSDIGQNQKNQLMNLLNGIKENVSQENELQTQTLEFDEIVSSIKSDIDDLIKNINSNNEIVSESSKDTVDKIDIELNPKDNKEININLSDKKQLEEIKTEIKNIVDDIKKILDTKDATKLQDVKTALNEVSKAIENNQEIKTGLEELNKNLQNLKDLLSKFEYQATPNQDVSINNNIELKTIENTQNKDVKNNIELDNLSSEDLKNLPKEDKISLDKILTVLEEYDINSTQLDENTKDEIKSLINKVKNNELTLDEIQSSIAKLPQEIKEEINTNSLNQNENNNTSSNVIDFNQIQATNQDTNNQNNQSNQNQSAQTKETPILKAQVEVDSNIDFNKDLELNETKDNISSQETKQTQQQDTQKLEESLQKAVYTQEMLDDLMVEVDIKTIPSQSGALTVSDEIAKLAIGESNSLNPITSVHGNIAYDSTGTNAILKNVASMMKQTPVQNSQAPSMEEILGQVSNKITQLKDNMGQRLTMVLRPNDLGRLSIELTTNNLGLTTNIMAQNDDVRMYIEKNIDTLRQQLSDAGVNVNNIQIKTMGQEGSTNYDGNQNLARENQQENQNQQNSSNNNNHQQHQPNKDAKEMLASLTNYDVQFAKDFSSVMNKSLSYGN